MPARRQHNGVEARGEAPDDVSAPLNPPISSCFMPPMDSCVVRLDSCCDSYTVTLMMRFNLCHAGTTRSCTPISRRTLRCRARATWCAQSARRGRRCTSSISLAPTSRSRSTSSAALAVTHGQRASRSSWHCILARGAEASVPPRGELGKQNGWDCQDEFGCPCLLLIPFSDFKYTLIERGSLPEPIDIKHPGPSCREPCRPPWGRRGR